MLFKHKDEPHNKLQVDLGDLLNERERLIHFIQTHLKATAVPHGKEKLTVDSENVTLSDLNHAVKKFVYSRGLNITHWVSLEGSTVKINRFKGHEKKKGKHERESPSQSLTQSWGL